MKLPFTVFILDCTSQSWTTHVLYVVLNCLFFTINAHCFLMIACNASYVTIEKILLNLCSFLIFYVRTWNLTLPIYALYMKINTVKLLIFTMHCLAILLNGTYIASNLNYFEATYIRTYVRSSLFYMKFDTLSLIVL